MSIDKLKLGSEFIIPQGEEKNYELIGSTIRNVRMKRNISQNDLAKVLNVDVEVIDAYENAEIAVPIYHFLDIAEYMKWPSEFDEMHKMII